MRGRSTLILLVVAAGVRRLPVLLSSEEAGTGRERQDKGLHLRHRQRSTRSKSSLASRRSDVAEKGSQRLDHREADPACRRTRTTSSDVVASVATLEQDRIVDENPTDFKTYGLAPPRIDVTFTVAGDKEPSGFSSATRDPTGMGVYAKLPNDKRVFLVANIRRHHVQPDHIRSSRQDRAEIRATKVDARGARLEEPDDSPGEVGRRRLEDGEAVRDAGRLHHRAGLARSADGCPDADAERQAGRS